jgi:ribosome-binding protein aMBF1 (putative translation factor)
VTRPAASASCAPLSTTPCESVSAPAPPSIGIMATSARAWLVEREAAETPGEAELRRRFEAAIALGLQYRDVRVARGLTQRQLAELTGVRQADISRIERGAGNPTEATLQRLAAALDCQLALD